MSQTWRNYGGINKTKPVTKIEAGMIIADRVVSRGVASITTELEQIEANKNLSLAGGDIIVVGNIIAKKGDVAPRTDAGVITSDRSSTNNLQVGNKLTFNSGSVNTKNFISGNTAIGKIGFGTTTPQSFVDLCGNLDSIGGTDMLRIINTGANKFRNRIIENKHGAGVDTKIDGNVTSINFFDNTKDISSNIDTPLASIQYNGKLTLQNKENINDLSKSTIELDQDDISIKGSKTVTIYGNGIDIVDVSADLFKVNKQSVFSLRTENQHLFNETMTVYDNSHTSFLSQYLPDSSNNYLVGSSIVSVGKDVSSSNFLSMVNSNRKGLIVGGGVHPNNRNSSVGYMGVVHETSSTTDTSFVPNYFIQEGTNSGYNRTTMGINTLTPTLNQYSLDVNGKTKIGHGEIHIRGIANGEINSMSFSRENSLFGVVTLKRNLRDIYVTTDGGQSWTKKLIGSIIITLTNGSYIGYSYNNSNILLITDVNAPNTNLTSYQYQKSEDGGNNWTQHEGSSGNEKGVGAGKTSSVYVVKPTNATEYILVTSEQGDVAPYNKVYTMNVGNVAEPSNITEITGATEIKKIHGYDNILYVLCNDRIVSLTLSFTLPTSSTIRNITTGLSGYTDLYVSDPSNAIIIGNGILAFTTNETTWTKIAKTGYDLFSVQMPMNNKAIVLYEKANTFGLLYSDVSLSVWNDVPDTLIDKSGTKSILYDHLTRKSILSISDNAKSFAITNVLTEYTTPDSGVTALVYNHFPYLLNRDYPVLDVSGSVNITGSEYVSEKLQVEGATTLNSTLNVALNTTLSSRLNVVRATQLDSTLNVNNSTTLQSNLDVMLDTSLNSNLLVAGDVSLNSKLFTVDDVSFNSKLNVGQAVQLDSTLNVNKSVTLQSNLDVMNDTSLNSNLLVAGDVSLNSKLFTVDDVSFNNKLNVGQAVQFDNILNVNKSTSLQSNLIVMKDASLNSNLLVAGDVSLNSKLFTLDDVSFNRKLNVGQSVQLDSTLNVNRSVTLQSNLDVMNDASLNSNLLVAGDVSLNSKLFTVDDTTLNNKLFVANDVSLNSKLFVRNSVHFDNILNVNQSTSLQSNLIVMKDASLNSNLLVAGDVSLNSKLFTVDDVSFNNKLNVGQAVHFDNILNVNQSTTLQSNLIVMQDTSLNSNLLVAGDVSLNRKLFVVDDVYFNKKLNVGQTVQFDNTLNVNDSTTLQSNLVVMQDASLNSNLLVAGEVSFNDTLYVVSSTTLNSSMHVQGIATMQTTLDVKGNLEMMDTNKIFKQF